ncbi:MAG TPA: sigma 54-interacting transcriptional regulator, partial [Clostridia bacterium]|nr:sigma 54-interacting transcriptional regulator [Clostridia bacterium]
MSKLQQVQEKAQKVAEAIATVLNMEVEIVDTDLVRVAGTGKVKNDIGRRLLRGFINKHVLRTGQHVFIDETGHHDICSSCPLYGNCFYLASIVHPIYVEDELIGNISLIAFDEKQKQMICGHEDSLVEFLSRMAEFISVKVLEKQMIKEKTVLVNRIQAVVDSVHEGVLALDQNGVITHFNRSGERLLGLAREQVIGQHIEDKIPSPLVGIIQEAKNEQEIAARDVFLNIQNKKLHLLVTVRTIGSEEGDEVGAVASFRDFGETEKLAYESLHRWETFTFDDIIGDSKEMFEIKEKANKVARGSSSVLIVGESGTGKELFARAIHSASPRKDKAFVAINCGAIPETLLESEFFGYEEGAFTGAKRGGKLGKFELAHKGTLFLDEISNMSLYLQAKLLRVLQERQIEKVGGTEVIPVDLRIIAATNADLHELVKTGRFRDDLYYR